MKKCIFILLAIVIFLSNSGCSTPEKTNIATTTLPIYEFTARLCSGSDLAVTLLITEEVSCLHDYSLQINQMQAIERADLVIINGAGLEDFMSDALQASINQVDASSGLTLHHDHHEHHSSDPHIWLSPEYAKSMTKTIYQALIQEYPHHKELFTQNLHDLLADLDELQEYGNVQLSNLSCREIICFHDGFSYFAESFDLHILKAVEEESGSEASAQTLIELTQLVNAHNIPAIFTEINGSASAANIISAETGVPVFTLDMAISGDSYFESMYRNIDIIREALQ